MPLELRVSRIVLHIGVTSWSFQRAEMRPIRKVSSYLVFGNDRPMSEQEIRALLPDRVEDFEDGDGDDVSYLWSLQPYDVWTTWDERNEVVRNGLVRDDDDNKQCEWLEVAWAGNAVTNAMLDFGEHEPHGCFIVIIIAFIVISTNHKKRGNEWDPLRKGVRGMEREWKCEWEGRVWEREWLRTRERCQLQ